MCGIIGYSGSKTASEILLQGLKRLEYRGYDSAGIAVMEKKNIKIEKCKGKIADLREKVSPKHKGVMGIGHTRWATHGEVNDINAHPHANEDGSLALVHNGIIENYLSLRERLQSQGCQFKSDTDTEVISHLISSLYDGDLAEAVQRAIPILKGTYGLVLMHRDEPDTLVGIRNGSPLVLGVTDDQIFLASDVTAILAHTKQVIYLEDGEMVTINGTQYEIKDIRNNIIDKEIETISWELDEIEKEGFSHYMEKEIYEQVESIQRAYQGRLDAEYGTAVLGGLNMSPQKLRRIQKIVILAAGTSYHAGLIGAYLFETMARLPAKAELASELRYRNPIVEDNTLYFAVSQSGETADTLYAMRELQRKGAKVLGICNVVGSSIPRESDGGVYIHSGPEIAVASTKAFTSQVTIFTLLSLLFARMRDYSLDQGRDLIKALQKIPEQIEAILEKEDAIISLAKKYRHAEHMLFLGRGINFPVALEGALKIKEVSYIHAEGYSAAEIKHGPIALIQEDTPSVFFVPDDLLRDKVLSNLKEVKARKGTVIAIAVEGDTEVAQLADDVIYVPKTREELYPLLMVIPTQILSYHLALDLGCNVDQPRNLAKSVTVE